MLVNTSMMGINIIARMLKASSSGLELAAKHGLAVRGVLLDARADATRTNGGRAWWRRLSPPSLCSSSLSFDRCKRPRARVREEGAVPVVEAPGANVERNSILQAPTHGVCRCALPALVPLTNVLTTLVHFVHVHANRGGGAKLPLVVVGMRLRVLAASTRK